MFCPLSGNFVSRLPRHSNAPPPPKASNRKNQDLRQIVTLVRELQGELCGANHRGDANDRAPPYIV